jgi:hypothetical protein
MRADILTLLVLSPTIQGCSFLHFYFFLLCLALLNKSLLTFQLVSFPFFVKLIEMLFVMDVKALDMDGYWGTKSYQGSSLSFSFSGDSKTIQKSHHEY